MGIMQFNKNTTDRAKSSLVGDHLNLADIAMAGTILNRFTTVISCTRKGIIHTSCSANNYERSTTTTSGMVWAVDLTYQVRPVKIKVEHDTVLSIFSIYLTISEAVGSASASNSPSMETFLATPSVPHLTALATHSCNVVTLPSRITRLAPQTVLDQDRSTHNDNFCDDPAVDSAVRVIHNRHHLHDLGHNDIHPHPELCPLQGNQTHPDPLLHQGHSRNQPGQPRVPLAASSKPAHRPQHPLHGQGLSRAELDSLPLQQGFPHFSKGVCTVRLTDLLIKI